jgi:hypothetical protein
VPANLIRNALGDTVDFSFLSHPMKDHSEELGDVSWMGCATCFGDFGLGFGCRWCIQLIDVHLDEERNELFNERRIMCDIERKFYSRAGIRAD